MQGQAKADSESKSRSPDPAIDLGGKPAFGINTSRAPLDLGRSSAGLESRYPVADQSFDPAIHDTESNGEPPGQVVQGQAKGLLASMQGVPDPALSELGALGRNLITATQLRIAAENKVRNLIRDNELTLFIEMEQQHVEKTQAMEAAILKQVLAHAKTIPYIKEMASLPGVGFKGAAKLVAIAGDPIWHSRDERLRTSGEWRAVLGMTPDSKHSMGTGSNPHPARPVLWNMAKVVVRSRGRNPGRIEPYSTIYEAEKERQASRVHAKDCGRCGVLVCKYEDCTEGGSLRAPHPGHARVKIKAGAGDPLSPGHIEARAIRLLMSEFADLFYRVRRDGV